MRRYTPLLLAAVLFCIVFVAGNLYLAGYADHDENKAHEEITVYTTLPTEHIAILAEAYENAHKVKVRFMPMTEKELLARLKEEAELPEGGADAVLSNKEVLIQAAKEGAFLNYVSEQTDIIPDRFKDERGAWVGVWYDPIVFCANKDYLKNLPVLPTSWEALAKLQGCRIGITDFLAADASANLLYTLVAEYDEQRAFSLLRQLQPKVVQYAKYLATPVRMAGMGEVDVSIAVQSESIRYINEGFPISLIYPAEGTAYMLTGVGVVKNAAHKTAAKSWLHWLTEDEAQLSLNRNQFFFVPTNQTLLAYKSFGGKNITLFENYSDLTLLQKADILDRWVKNIRFK